MKITQTIHSPRRCEAFISAIENMWEADETEVLTPAKYLPENLTLVTLNEIADDYLRNGDADATEGCERCEAVIEQVDRARYDVGTVELDSAWCNICSAMIGVDEEHEEQEAFIGRTDVKTIMVTRLHCGHEVISNLT